MQKHLKIKINKLVLVIIPAVFMIIALLIHFGKGKFYFTHVDPEYFHLFNGLNLSIFNLAIDFIDHPGTSLQVIFAVSAHIVNFILPGNDIISNALNNPEQFIHGANILMNLLTTGSLIFLGFYTLKKTGNILLALLLQLAPFSSYHLLTISGRLIPEAVLLAPLFFVFTLIIIWLNDDNKEINTNKYIIGFAILGGLGMAGKLLFLPFLIIPLFLLPTFKLRIRYALYTFIAMLIFAFPMFIHIGKSWDWVSSMFLHSGKYGKGDQNIIAFSSIPENISKLYMLDKGFFVLAGLAVIQFITLWTFYLFGKFKSLKPYLIAALAVLTSIILSILIIVKHFSPQYFYPTLAFKFFIIFLMAETARKITLSKKIALGISIFALFIAFMIVNQQRKILVINLNHTHILDEKFENREQILKDYNTFNNPLIITSHYRGSPFIESSLVAGFLMSGSLKSTFIEQLTESYPNTYFYYDWSEHFYLWNQFKDAKEFITPGKPTYIFIGEGLERNLNKIIDRLKVDFPNYQPDLKLLHYFKDPDEYFYEICFVEDPPFMQN